jgi:hypothetical protein
LEESKENLTLSPQLASACVSLRVSLRQLASAYVSSQENALEDCASIRVLFERVEMERNCFDGEAGKQRVRLIR